MTWVFIGIAGFFPRLWWISEAGSNPGQKWCVTRGQEPNRVEVATMWVTGGSTRGPESPTGRNSGCRPFWQCTCSVGRPLIRPGE